MKISTHSLVLPLLVGLAAFSSKTKFPDYELMLFFSWALFLTCAILFIRSIRYRAMAVSLVSILIVIRLLIQLTDAPTIIMSCYFAGGFVIMVFAGLSVFLKIPTLLLRQMYWLAAISVIMSLLQIHGVAWAQEFGSGIDDKGLSAGRVWFQGYDVVSEELASIVQARPDGFTHANNLTSQLLLMFYAFSFYCYTAETGLPKASASGLFLISLASALNGGKVIVLGIGLIYFVAFVFLGQVKKTRIIRAAGIMMSAYLTYYLVFPGLFTLNFNLDLFVHNASGRIINFGVLAKTDKLESVAEFIGKLGSDYYISSEYIMSENYKLQDVEVAYSGLAALVPYLPVFLVAGFVSAVIYRHHAWRLRRLHILNLPSASAIVSVALIACIFGGPFYKTVWFTFFFSLAIAPLLCRFFNQHFIESMSRPRD